MTQTKRQQWLIYGATGYTGSHVAELALARGLRPALAGRNEKELRALGERLGLEWHVCDLADTAALHALIRQYSTVLHCAGPYVHTYEAMIEACLAGDTHYLDLTGEIPIFEALAGMDQRARDAGIMIMPAVGFDMVPGDCLALMLKRLMPDATELDIGVSYEGTLSQGSIRSALLLRQGTFVRRNHQLVPLAEKLKREFDFGPGRCGGRLRANALTFGDISIGWRTTGIPNITAYQRPVPQFLEVLRNIKSPDDIAALPRGPTAEELATIPTLFVGEARNAAGDAIALRLVCPQSYALTFDLAATIAQRVHEGMFRRGFQTPACVFGEDFITEFDGCSIQPWPVS